MASKESMEDLSDREMAELAAFADGSPLPNREAIAERVAGSPKLQRIVAEQQRALKLLGGAAAQERAPQALRESLSSQPQRPRRRRARTRRGGMLSLGLATAGVIALAVVALLPGSAQITTAQAASFARLPATAPAPAQSKHDPATVTAAVDGVAFPYWSDRFGWHTSGARSDRLGARRTETVFYSHAHGTVQVGYTIVGGPAITTPAGATRVWSNGTLFLAFRQGARNVVTWERHRRTCVLSGAAVPVRTLLQLASWEDSGSL